MRERESESGGLTDLALLRAAGQTKKRRFARYSTKPYLLPLSDLIESIKRTLLGHEDMTYDEVVKRMALLDEMFLWPVGGLLQPPDTEEQEPAHPLESA